CGEGRAERVGSRQPERSSSNQQQHPPPPPPSSSVLSSSAGFHVSAAAVSPAWRARSSMTTMNSSKQHFSMHAALHEPKYPGLHAGAGAGAEGMRRVCLSAPQGNIFGGFDESLLVRAEALAAADGKSHPFKADVTYHTMSSVPCTSSSSSSSSASATVSHTITSPHHLHHHHHLLLGQSLEAGDLLDHLSSGLSVAGMGGGPSPEGPSPVHHNHNHNHHQHHQQQQQQQQQQQHHPHHPHHPHHHHHHLQTMGQLHQAMASMHPHAISVHGGVGGVGVGGVASSCVSDVESDPRELEAFAERFKQRRIKLGVTQADVGSALANLKIPGVGSLSQSTICRFESLTLSHNNMIALKPVLQAWLEEAEAAHREKNSKPDPFSGSERKRKRTSIAAPEKRSLEAYFAIQPRPSSEKIAAIAEKLDLKKNVVRVWFCNQRQKQKRMKYSAVH
ncbi:hypothetical protein CRUP_032082, partial [Coryphaenoides rupestris]